MKQKFKNKLAKEIIWARIILILAFWLEIGIFTNMQRVGGPFLTPILALSSGIFIGAILLLLSIKYKAPEQHTASKLSWLIIPFSLVCFGLMYYFVPKLFAKYPFEGYSLSFSDVLPTVVIFIDRFKAGIFPYDWIHDWGYSLFPTYFPLKWFPFLLPDYLNVDLRYLPLWVYTISTVIFQWKIFKSPMNDLVKVLIALLPFLPVFYCYKFEPMHFGVTFEYLMAGYYMLFCFAVLSRNILWIALGLLLCLLSRYSLVLWTPLFFFILMIKKGFKPAFICGCMVLAGILLFYLIPFISQDPQMFSKAMETYKNAALGEWRGQHWNAGVMDQGQLFNGTGFASWVYAFSEGSPEDKLAFMQKLHLIISFGVVLFMTLIFWFKRHEWDLRYFAIGSLKIYLAFFYAFLQVPYYYLMMIPVAVSLITIYCSFNLSIKKAPQ